MSFLDKLGGIAKNIGDKTGEMLAVNKLNSKIHAEQQAAAEELRKIGEYYYNLFLSGGQTAPEIAEFCQSAKSHYDEAAQAQRRRHRRKSAGSVRKRKRPRLRRLLHKLRPRLTVRYAPRAARPLPRA